MHGAEFKTVGDSLDKGDHFFDETMQGLLEAAEIAKGNITLTEWENMPAPTFYVADNV